jgi:hypothetical protein
MKSDADVLFPGNEKEKPFEMKLKILANIWYTIPI